MAKLPVGIEPWRVPYAAYLSAREAHEAFMRDVLDPAYAEARAAAGPALTPAVMELEDRCNDLCAARHEALHVFVRAPARDAETVRLKLRLAYEEAFKYEDNHGMLKAILADLDRLIA